MQPIATETLVRMSEADFDALDGDAQVVEWNRLSALVKAAKETELRMRSAVIARKFGDNTKIGTNNLDLGRGYKLKAVRKQYYRLPSDTDVVDEALDKLPDWLAGRLIKWKAELSVSEYKKLTEEQKAIIDEIVTVSEGSPELTLVEPKA